MMRYDGILFGNGLSINLLNQLKPYVPVEKRYLLNIDEFVKCWIESKLSAREERQIYRAFYGNNKNQDKLYQILKSAFKEYYEKYDSNIEYAMGCMLFQDDNRKECLQFYPILYNIWHIILKDYLMYCGMENRIQNFYKTVFAIVKNSNYIWTTNFDLFAEDINVKHIHGRFVENIKNYSDIIYKYVKNGTEYRYKYIWGHNGTGKMFLIEELKQYKDHKDYFDFDFFYSNDIMLEKLLIYGMGFKPAGFIDELKTLMPRYNKAAYGAIIDEHIFLRISGMQKLGILKQVDIAYYNEIEKQYFEEVLRETHVENYNFIPSKSFDFSVENI